MSWVLAKKPETVKATRKLAEEFANMTPCPHDRPIKPPIMRMLDKAVNEQQLRTCLWAKAFCKATGETYRVNGKHTSTKLSTVNGELKEWPYVQVEEYVCDTLEDVADLYCTFDPSRSGRSSGDVNRIYLATNPELADVPARTFSACVTAVAYATFEDGYAYHDPRERAQLALAQPGFVLWFYGVAVTRDGRVFHRGPVAAAMFKTWQKAQKAATEFWTAVRDATGPTPTLPCRKLSKFLLGTSSAIALGMNTGKPKATQREFYVRCIHAWNAWRKGEATDLKYYPASKTPAVV
jgi:hypothetical protein